MGISSSTSTLGSKQSQLWQEKCDRRQEVIGAFLPDLEHGSSDPISLQSSFVTLKLRQSRRSRQFSLFVPTDQVSLTDLLMDHSGFKSLYIKELFALTYAIRLPRLGLNCVFDILAYM